MAVTLYDPVQIGPWECKNRLVMAPLTRMRASARVPNDLMVEYYAQRSSAGLIIAEASQISPKAIGYANTPGMHSQEQVIGWKKITDAVHKNGGKIVAQLWHVGRISHPSLLDGDLPLSPSAVKPDGLVRTLRPPQEYATPREATLKDIDQVVADFKAASVNAKKAGFDGIDIHSANGYLIDQFIQDGVNKRTDEYGGTIENRCRLLFRVFDAIAEVWGANRIGLHLAPVGDFHDMGDSNPVATFSYILEQAKKRQAGFVFIRLPREHQATIGKQLRTAFADGGKTSYILNHAIERDEAEQLVASGQADAIGFGQLFIANPDLPRRFQTKSELNKPDVDSFYYSEIPTHGYTDYPFLKA